MTTTCPIPSITSSSANAQTESLKKKLRTMQWKPEVVMRETVLIQRLRELLLDGCER
jgi:hypothetical protein